MNSEITTCDKRPLSLGFIGGATSSAVGYSHFVACGMDKQWSLDAGCFSTNAEENIESAIAYGVPRERLYNDWHSLIEREKDRLDAVLVLTPTPTHCEIVSACLQKGIAVICEKALAVNAEEIKTLIAERDNHKGFLAVTYNYSGYPMIRELKHLIESGKLGEICHFQAEMPQEGFIRVDSAGKKPQPQHWRLQDQSIPTIHLDLAVHLHQLIYYLIKRSPQEVISNQGSSGWFEEIIDNVSCLSRYSGNVQGQFWFSKSALGHRNGLRLRVYGSKASAEWFQANPEELLISGADGRREILDRASMVEHANVDRYGRFKPGHPAGFIEAFANLYTDIANSLRQYQSSNSWQSAEVFGAELALEGLSFLEAMVDSVEDKSWKPVENRIVT